MLRYTANFLFADLGNVKLLDHRYLRLSISIKLLVNIVFFTAVLSIIHLDRSITSEIFRLI